MDRTNPTSATSSGFADVDADLWWAPYNDRLAEPEITLGYDTQSLRFGPDRTVNRAQMATLLVSAFKLPAAPTPGFADTAGNTHQARIDALAAAGVTAGCEVNPPRYCPNQPVTRADGDFPGKVLGLV